MRLTILQLQHLHLVSKHRYPLLANPSLETIVSYLIEAPKIMRDMAPVHWQYLDAPQDGALFLTWQPLEYLNTNFASDGYVWADAEQPFNSEVRGYVRFTKQKLSENGLTFGRLYKCSGIELATNLKSKQ